MKTYKEQAEEIKRLAEIIVLKSQLFANKEHTSAYFQDLAHIIEELKELDHFLHE